MLPDTLQLMRLLKCAMLIVCCQLFSHAVGTISRVTKMVRHCRLLTAGTVAVIYANSASLWHSFLSFHSVCMRSFWKKRISQEELLSTAAKVQADAWKAQSAAGIDLIGLDGTLYDQVTFQVARLKSHNANMGNKAQAAAGINIIGLDSTLYDDTAGIPLLSNQVHRTLKPSLIFVATQRLENSLGVSADDALV